MRIHFRRLLIVLLVALVGIGGGYVFYRRSGSRHRATNLAASARQFLDKGDFASARIETEKLLRLGPDSVDSVLLHAEACLAGRRPEQIKLTDSGGIEGIRGLITATRHDPDRLAPQKMLVEYFLASGDLEEAARRAKGVLRLQSDDAVARYALATWLLNEGKAGDAGAHIQFLLAQERPVRPRTALLLTRWSDATARDDERRTSARRLADQVRTHSAWTDPRDRLALIELAVWQARFETEATKVADKIQEAIGEAQKIVESNTDLPPRAILNAIDCLSAESVRGAPNLRLALVAQKGPVEALFERVYAQAISSGALDPSVYVSYANRLTLQGQPEKGVAVVQAGIERAKSLGPEIRKSFGGCDLWLAEHFLSERQTDRAQVHIEALLTNDAMRPYGQLLAGHQQLQSGNVEAAYESLSEAANKLPKHGAANALFGLCLVRRGLVTEGRHYLEKGISLGADAPQYQAWLALALDEGGFHDQAIHLARDILAKREGKGLGRAILGQLRLRAGQYEEAERDFKEALNGASPDVRAPLELSQAEVAIARGDFARAAPILARLKSTSLAPQAYAVEYRTLVRQGQAAVAGERLAEGRKRFPDSALLFAMDIARCFEARDFSAARPRIEAQKERDPQSILPVLFMAEWHERQNDPEAALAVLRQGLEERPREVSLRIRLAERQLALKKFDEAGKTIADLKGDPKVNPSTLDYLLARLAWMQGDRDTAEEILKRAAAKDPDNPTLKFLMGQVAAGRGDYVAAAGYFEQAMMGGSFPEHVVQALFESLLRTGATERALELLTQAEQRGIKVRSMRAQLVRVLAQKERWDSMTREVTLLLEGEPTEEEAALGVSMLRFARRMEDAGRWLDRLTTRFPKSPWIAEQRAALLVDQKQLVDAAEVIEAALKEHPKSAGLHLVKVQLESEKKNFDEALAAAQKGWQACPGHRGLEALVVLNLLRRGADKEAIAFAQQAKVEHPDLPTAKYLVARMHESLGHGEQAMLLLAEALQEEPTSTTIANHFVRLMIARNQTEGLDAEIAKLLEKNPRNELLQGVLAEIYAARRDFPKAQKLLEDLERIEQTGPLISYLRGVVAAAKRDYEGAERYLQAAQADARGHVPSTLLLAQIRVEQNRLADALDLAGQIRRQRPTLEPAQVLYARLLLELGRDGEAEAAARDCLTLLPASRSARLVLAQALLRQARTRPTETDKKAQAVRLAEAILEDGVPSPTDLELCIRMLIEGGSASKARPWIEKFSASDRDPALAVAAGRGALVAGVPEMAREIAERTMARSPSLAARLLLADAIARAATDQQPAQIERAVEEYRSILRDHPGHFEAANNLAWNLGNRLGKPHRAFEEFVSAVPAGRTANRQLPAEALDTLGVLHLLMGHATDAQEYLEVAMAKAPRNPAIAFHLGEAYRKAGRHPRAKQCFEQAVRLDPSGPWAKRIARESLLGN